MLADHDFGSVHGGALFTIGEVVSAFAARDMLGDDLANVFAVVCSAKRLGVILLAGLQEDVGPRTNESTHARGACRVAIDAGNAWFGNPLGYRLNNQIPPLWLSMYLLPT